MSKHPSDWKDDYQGRLVAMLELAQAAGRRTLDFFGDGALKVERKGDLTPVTEADRAAEQLIRQRLRQSFADDSILGEEFGEVHGDSGFRWIIDPIDGTKSFICGVPLYATLVGLEQGDQVVGGAVVIPVLDEMLVAATGCGTWHRQTSHPTWQAATVSQRTSLDDAVFVTSQVDSFAHSGGTRAYEALQSAASITRTWGDAYGYLLVATGRADIMVDPLVSPWDVAAVLPAIKEAGGQFSDWTGAETIRGGTALCTNGHLHELARHLLGA